MPRGIIMSISGREAVVLTKDSDFVKVVLPKGEYDIGQEIYTADTKYSSINRWMLSRGRKLTAIAAALIVAVILPMAATAIFMNTAVYAYVTLDVNPSTEFSINGREKIIKAKPLNEEGALVLEGVDLRGREIEYGIEYFVTKSCELGYAAPGVEGAVIATTVMEKEENTKLEQKISETLEKSVEQNKLTVETGVLAATKEIKKEAEKAGVSAGKYLIALQAREEQLEVNMEDVKKSSISSAINKAGGDLQSILRKARKTNEELAELLEKNREKLRDKRDREKDDDRINDKGGRINAGQNNRSSNKNEGETKKADNRSTGNNRSDNLKEDIHGRGKKEEKDYRTGRDSKEDRDKGGADIRDSGRKKDDKWEGWNKEKTNDNKDSRANDGKDDYNWDIRKNYGRNNDNIDGGNSGKGKDSNNKENGWNSKDQQNSSGKSKAGWVTENKMPGMVSDILKRLFDKNRLPR